MPANFDFIPSVESAPSQPISGGDFDFTPVHEFNHAPIAASTADRDELANMWLSSQDFTGEYGPTTPQQLEAIKTKAAAAGMSLDDVMASAQEKMPWSERMATKLYRNGGPVYRGAINSAGSTAAFFNNAALRGLSNVPGWEHLATKADENNRAQMTDEAIAEQLNREGSTAQILGSGGAALLGNASQGVMDIATLSAATGGAGAAAEAGATAEATAAAAKAANLGAAKKAAIYFGLKTGERQLTVATDAGLSPNMRLASAAGHAAITGAFTYGFGAWAESLGIATKEQAIMTGGPAVERLMSRTGLLEAANEYAFSGGEQAAMSLAEQSWGSFIGTDTMDDWQSRAGTGFVTGVAIRGAGDLPAFTGAAGVKFRKAYAKTQEEMPDTVRGTLAAQNVTFKGAPAKSIENETPAFKAAYQSELDAVAEMHAQASKSLDTVKLGEESLKARMDKFLAAKRALEPVNADNTLTEVGRQQLRDKGFTDAQIDTMTVSNEPPAKPSVESQAQSALNKEGLDIRAERAKLVESRKTAEADLKAAEDLFNELGDSKKDEIKAKVAEDVHSAGIAKGLEDGKVNLTRAENELLSRYRAQEGYSELPDAEKISGEQKLIEAYSKGIVVRADDIAKDIVSTNRGMTDAEQSGLFEARYHRGDSIKAAEAVLADPAATETAKRDASLARDTARKSEDVITRALNAGASDPARLLARRRHDADNLKPNTVRETARERKGSDLTAAEADGLTADAEKVAETENRARQAASEKPVKGPLNREGFIFRETLRAEQRKGSLLTKEEADSVAAHAARLYDTTADIHTLDAERLKETANKLYLDADKARSALEAKVLALEPKTFGGQAAFAGGILREYLTTGELAPPILRNGILYPSLWASGMKRYWKSLVSESSSRLFGRDIKTDSHYRASQEGDVKLRLMERHSPFEFQEGGMAAKFFAKFPLLRRFSDAYRDVNNHFRLGAFKILTNAEGGLSKWNTEGLNRVKGFVNTGTGYGTLGKFESSAAGLADWMLAPRFFFSRLQYFTGWPMWKAAYAGDGMATKVMLKTYAKQVAGLAAMTAIAEAAGKAAFGDDAVEFYRNPMDFNFGRLRVGSTMIDITGGLAKPFRYATSLAEPLISKFQDRPSLKQTGPTLLGIGRSALAPVPSALVSAADVYANGKDVNGEMQKYIFPWSWSDSVKALMDEGMDKGSAIAALNMLGGGSYTTERK